MEGDGQGSAAVIARDGVERRGGEVLFVLIVCSPSQRIILCFYHQGYPPWSYPSEEFVLDKRSCRNAFSECEWIL